MNVSDLCIRRPVFATMLMATLVVLGIFSFVDLGIDFFPKIDIPYVTVSTRYPGAGPEEIETQVTKIIEESINTIEGIDELYSQSYEGLSLVTVAFKLYRDVDMAAQDVRDRVNRIQARLPLGLDPSIIEKIDPNATPVLTLVASSPHPIRELTRIARRQLKENLESVPGVGQIQVVGGQEREIHVLLDATKLNAYGVTPFEVKAALKRQNVEMPGGLVQTGARDLGLRLMGRVERPAEFAKVIIREQGGSLIRIEDVATVVDAQEEQRSLARLDGRSAVALVIQKQSGSNTVEVVRGVKNRLEVIRPSLPPDVRVEFVRDRSRVVVSSFNAVIEHIIVGALLASLVVLLFLGELRTSIMVALSIPVSIVSTFTLMRYEDFTLNNLSLLALALAVGLVIDDAVVVYENTFRHMTELDKDPATATRDAVREIGLAVMATTLSLMVIFVPIAFMPGIVGRFFKTFGLTMTFAIFVSLVVSFTMTPALTAHFLRRREGHGAADRPGDHASPSRSHMDVAWAPRLIDRLTTRPYLAMLRWAMAHRFAIIVCAALCIAAIGPLIRNVGQDFLPQEDRCEFLVNVKAPEGSSVSGTSGVLGRIEADLAKFEGVTLLFTTIGQSMGAKTNEGEIYVGLVDVDRRRATQQQLMKQIRELLARRYPELTCAVSIVPDMAGNIKENDLIVSLQGPELDQLRRYGHEILELLRGTPGIVDVDTSLTVGKPEIRVDVDRQLAASLGVDLFEVASSLRTMIGGDQEQVTRFKDQAQSEEYEVRTRLAPQFRNRPEVIADLPIRGRSALLKLGSLARVRESVGPVEIDRYGRQRQVAIYTNLQGISLGDAQNRIDEKIRSMKLKPGYSYAYIGRSKVFREQQLGFMIAFALSTIFMYIVLAAQFESLVYPISIMVVLPLTVPFGILSLMLAGETMNLFSTLGLFMLFGIVKKNAILQVDYTNTLRATGLERLPAIIEANRTRLRPILMTTLTLVAGMVPMALGAGPGSSWRRGTAIVVIGGQALCLLITLLVTPVVYSLLDDVGESRLVRRLRRVLD